MAEPLSLALPPGRIRPLAESDLQLVLSWRNHPDIRRFMFRHEIIPMAEHLAWFERLSRDASTHLLVYEQEGTPLGFARLARVDGGSVAEWGFYAAPAAPRGTGTKLGRATLGFAFDSIDLHKVCGKVASYNEPSLRFHRKLGFREEGVLREQLLDGGERHDVHCFGLLAPEWHAAERPA